MNSPSLLADVVLSVCLAFLSSLAAAGPPVKETPTTILILKTGGRATEFSPVMEIARVDFESPTALKVQLADGRSESVFKGAIERTFVYPDPIEYLAGKACIEHLTVKKAEAEALAKAFANARAYLGPVVKNLDADLGKLAAGQVRLHGIWQSKEQPLGGTAQFVPGKDFAVLVVGGQTYRSVEITKIENGLIGFTHEDGAGRMDPVSAPPEVFKKLWEKPGLLASFRPAAQFSLGDVVLTNAMLLGRGAGGFKILHRGGVVQVEEASLSESQKQLLVATAPALAEAAKKKQEDAKVAMLQEAKEKEDSWPPGVMTEVFSPDVSVKQFSPSYQETMEFINAKLKEDIQSIGYGMESGKMIYRVADHSHPFNSSLVPGVVVVFDPAELNPEVLMHNQQNAEGFTSAAIVLRGRNGKNVLTLYRPVRQKDGTHKCEVVTSASCVIPIATAADLQKMAAAFSHLILMFGGRKEAF